MLRPGFLGKNTGPFNGLFGGDKADFEPPPEPPPPMGPEQFKEIELPDGSLYQQDKRCAEGERTTQVPCVGSDCDPGEMDFECASDPEFKKVAEKPETPEKAKIKKQEEIARAEEERAILAEQEDLRRQEIDQARAIQRMQEEKAIKQYVTLGIAGIGVLTIGLIIMKIVR